MIWFMATMSAVTGLIGWLGGRSWEHAEVILAYEEGRADERARSGPLDGSDAPEIALADVEQAWNSGEPVIVTGRPARIEEGPLVPLPARLPSAAQREAMYDTLADGRAIERPRPESSGEPVTIWDTAEREERAPTVWELAETARYVVTWQEIDATVDSAWRWYERTFTYPEGDLA